MGHKSQLGRNAGLHRRLWIVGSVVGSYLSMCYWYSTQWSGLLPQHTFAFSSSSSTSSSCSPEQAVLNANYFISIGYDRSNCPDEAWLEDLQALDPPSADKLFINIGVNKGYNFLHWLNVWRPDISVCPLHWRNALDVPEEEACGSCNDCEKACRPSRLNDSISALPKLTMLGVDPNAFTLASLEKAIHRLHLQERPGIDVHLVLGAAGDKAGEVMLNEFCGKNGNEVCAVQEGGENSGGIRVPMFTIDGLGAASKRVKDVLRSRQGPIDILHIDTEGYDPKVLKGALGTLRSGGIRMLSFEYHSVGLWKELSLKAVVAFLDDVGYACWFQGQRRLFRITGCYVPQWETKTWSNVVCANRRDSYYSVLTQYEFWYEAPLSEADQKWARL